MKVRVNCHPYYIKNHIKCCLEWKDYIIFEVGALNNEYTNELSLDRQDAYKDYLPSKWESSDF